MQRLLGVWFCNNYYVTIANSGSVRTLVYFFLICSSSSINKSSILQPRSIVLFITLPNFDHERIWKHVDTYCERWFTKMFEHSQVTRTQRTFANTEKVYRQETKVTICNQETAFKLFCIYRTFADGKSRGIHLIWKNI